MTLENKRPLSDIQQAEHENDANAHRFLMMAKTTSGTYIPIILTDEGKLG